MNNGVVEARSARLVNQESKKLDAISNALH